MSLKVAVVSHIYPTHSSPARATFIKNEARLLSNSFQTEVYLPSVYSLPFQSQFYRTRDPSENELPVHRFHYFSIPKRNLPSITRRSLAKKLLNTVQDQKPDIIHCHWLFPSGLAVPQIKEKGYKAVITIHGGDWYSNLGNEFIQSLILESLNAADGIVCVGNRLLDNISEKYPQIREKLFHIPHGIDTDLFKPAKNQSNLKKQLRWEADKIHFLCVANMYREKGIDLLIKAVSQMNSINFHLHIISAHQSEVEKKIVTNLITLNDLEHRVTFYDARTQKELVPYLQAADILISPSRKEGFGLVVAEAISSGIPVLATRSGGPEEIVSEKTGILVEADNHLAIYEGLLKLVSNLDRYNSNDLHEDIKHRFSRSSKLKKLSNLYNSIS